MHQRPSDNPRAEAGGRPARFARLPRGLMYRLLPLFVVAGGLGALVLAMASVGELRAGGPAPIMFVDRQAGSSKMSIAEITRYIRLCCTLCFTRTKFRCPNFGPSSPNYPLLRSVTDDGEKQLWR